MECVFIKTPLKLSVVTHAACGWYTYYMVWDCQGIIYGVLVNVDWRFTADSLGPFMNCSNRLIFKIRIQFMNDFMRSYSIQIIFRIINKKVFDSWIISKNIIDIILDLFVYSNDNSNIVFFYSNCIYKTFDKIYYDKILYIIFQDIYHHKAI